MQAGREIAIPRLVPVALWLLLGAFASASTNYPAPVEAAYIIHDFHFHSGQSLPELQMHYRTFGEPRRDAQGIVRNAVLILHGTTGSGAQFLRSEFADQLYEPGQPLDVTRYYLILVDNIGHGKSSKPSDGLHAKFPNYGYLDMIEAQYRLLNEGLKVNHLRLVMGTSMGGMHTWLWGELHPDFMDALMPLASLPTQISGRNRVWRRQIMDAIRDAPDWQNGEYSTQPSSMRAVEEMLYFMGSNPVLRAKEAPTLKQADQVLDTYIARVLTNSDANDTLYALASSYDYDPGPGLEKITAPLVAINSADDLINPPELKILEREIKRVKNGKAIVLPYSDQTVGHGSHTKAVLWKKYLVGLLKKSQTKAAASALEGPVALLLDPGALEMNRRAPDLFKVRLATSKGDIVIQVHRDWAPNGADHFYNLVRAGYYDDTRFFRVDKDRWAQFGINGNPGVSQLWRTHPILDEPRVASNRRGTIAYAFAMRDGRATQVFINLRDNSATHDPEPFVPFGEVLEGMSVADALNTEYGEASGGGIRGGKQGPLYEIGNTYLDEHFPRLDSIRRAAVEPQENVESVAREKNASP
jgi:homoserine O-acetyltransferase